MNRKNFDDYLKENHGTYFSKGQIFFIWTIIRSLMVKYLADSSSYPLDLGFCKIYALPLRIDWMERWLAENFTSMRLSGSEPIPHETFVKGARSCNLKAIPTNGRHKGNIQWSLFIRAKKDWTWRHNTEEEKRRKLSPTEYAKYHDEFLAENYAEMAEILAAFCRQATLPIARVQPCGPDGGHQYVAEFPEYNVANASYLFDKVYLNRKPKISTKAPQGRPRGKTRRVKTPKVSEVRDVPPTALDVRESEGVVPESSHGSEGTAGMPLHHAPESAATV